MRTILRALDIDLPPPELEIVRKQIDPDNEGVIRFENLVLVMEDKLKEVDTFEDCIEQFAFLDKDKDGNIPNPEYKQFMTNLGQKMSLEELEEMMKEGDPKAEGQINIETFCQRLCPPKPVPGEKKAKKGKK